MNSINKNITVNLWKIARELNLSPNLGTISFFDTMLVIKFFDSFIIVSEKHGGFIINRGNATCAEVVALIEHCQKTVFEKFGVSLETEVKMIGEK